MVSPLDGYVTLTDEWRRLVSCETKLKEIVYQLSAMESKVSKSQGWRPYRTRSTVDQAPPNQWSLLNDFAIVILSLYKYTYPINHENQHFWIWPLQHPDVQDINVDVSKKSDLEKHLWWISTVLKYVWRMCFYKLFKCVEKATRTNCPVCLEDLHTSRAGLAVLRCGHICHR